MFKPCSKSVPAIYNYLWTNLDQEISKYESRWVWSNSMPSYLSTGPQVRHAGCESWPTEYKATKYDPRCPTVTSPGLFRVEGGDRCTALHLTGTKPALVAPLGTTQIQRQILMHICKHNYKYITWLWVTWSHGCHDRLHQSTAAWALDH